VDVIPAIDIKDGRCVRLYQGDYDRVTVFGDDPAEIARRWEREGATIIHVVDLDGASDGALTNLSTIERVITSVGVGVEVSGGIRSVAAASALFERGAARVVVGTAAVEKPDLVDAISSRWPGRLAVGIDARDGVVLTRGWKVRSEARAVDLARDVVTRGASWIIYTDVERDGTLTEPNYASTAELVGAVDIPVIASGGIARVDQIDRLRSIGVAGVIVGRALYSGDVRLPEALALVAATS
jgi:phosphoribosylformimino-5-aminoimidazole carboxamide ribotide isomerase